MQIPRSARDDNTFSSVELARNILILSLGKIHQMVMFSTLKKLAHGVVCKGLAAMMPLILLTVSTVACAHAQTTAKSQSDPKVDHYYEPLPQETGSAGLQLMLRRLQTTGRLMQVDAHPDDEDGGMLTLEARGKGVSTLLMTLNRGEGGQNKLGSNLFDALGVLRTLEVLASDRYYGVEQRFSRVADFGYSKTAEETFQKWQGHDIALADIVRVIRAFHPDVLVARFSGTDRDGHGHHQASAILTQEAFRAAGDPKRFPEQLKGGLEPWQPKKLYIGNVCGFGAMTCDAANYTLRLNTGAVDPALGASYIQFAMQGLRHQQSQGAAQWTVEPGDRFTYYKLVDSVVESPKDKDGHEQSFFDGIDTTLPGLASRLGDEEKKVPWLRGELTEIKAKITEATAAAEKDSVAAVDPLTTGSLLITKVSTQLKESSLSTQRKNSILLLLEAKEMEIARANGLAQGVTLHVVVDGPVGSTSENAFMAVPGRTFEVTGTLSATDRSTVASNINLQVPQGWISQFLGSKPSGNSVEIRFKVFVSPTAEPTKPYWHRNNPETEALNIIDDPQYQGLPFSSPPVTASGTFGKPDALETISADCMVRYKDSSGAISERPLAVAPAFSVLLDPGEQVMPTVDGPQSSAKVDVSSNLESKTLQQTYWKGDPQRNAGGLRMEAPEGWKIEPGERQVTFQDRGEVRSVDFKVLPGNRTEGRKEIRASLQSGHQSYSEGYSVVTRDDLGTSYYYQPAVQRVSIVMLRFRRT